MRILDRYIFKSVLGLFLGCLLVFFGLYIIIDLFSHLDEILKLKVDIATLVLYYMSYLPIIFIQVSPVACLLSTLYTLGRLNRDNEIIAMRSSGLSVLQITKTIIIFGLIVSVFIFMVNDRFVPGALNLTERIKARMESGKNKGQDQENQIINNLSMYGLKNRLIFINKFSLATNTMEGITILEHDEQQDITKKIVANKGVYKNNLWRFYQSITYNFDKNGQIISEPQYLEEEIMTIPETPKEFLNQRQKPEGMTISQLQEYIWKLSESGATSVLKNLNVELYQRFSYPLISVIIMLLGIPFSLKMKRHATGMSSIGLSIMVGFLYYALNAISIAFGKAGILAPLLAATLPHILAFATAVYLISILP